MTVDHHHPSHPLHAITASVPAGYVPPVVIQPHPKRHHVHVPHLPYPGSHPYVPPYSPVTASVPYHVSYPGHPYDPYGMHYGSPYGAPHAGGPMHIHYH